MEDGLGRDKNLTGMVSEILRAGLEKFMGKCFVMDKAISAITGQTTGTKGLKVEKLLGCNQLFTQRNQKLRKCKANVVYKNTED